MSTYIYVYLLKSTYIYSYLLKSTSQTLVSLNLGLRDLLGPVTIVKKKKKKICDQTLATSLHAASERDAWVTSASGS